MKKRPRHMHGKHREPRSASMEELEHEDEMLDEWLEETFPTSDTPAAVQPGHAPSTPENRVKK